MSNNRIMYQVIVPGTYGSDGFNSEVLKFTPDLDEAKKVEGEIWEIVYEGFTWKRWKEKKILDNFNNGKGSTLRDKIGARPEGARG